MSEIVKDLKALALELDRPIVVLSQISRAPEYREDHRPILSDFYASDAVIQYADVVTVHRVNKFKVLVFNKR